MFFGAPSRRFLYASLLQPSMPVCVLFGYGLGAADVLLASLLSQSPELTHRAGHRRWFPRQRQAAPPPTPNPLLHVNSHQDSPLPSLAAPCPNSRFVHCRSLPAQILCTPLPPSALTSFTGCSQQESCGQGKLFPPLFCFKTVVFLAVCLTRPPGTPHRVRSR